MTIHCDDWEKVKLDPIAEQAKAWRALMKDINAEPCECPDLRDSLHDWMRKPRVAVNGDGK